LSIKTEPCESQTVPQCINCAKEINVCAMPPVFPVVGGVLLAGSIQYVIWKKAREESPSSANETPLTVDST
jgi:hypothetical protein